MKKGSWALGLVLALLIHFNFVWSQDARPPEPPAPVKAEPQKPPEPRPDPTGASAGDKTTVFGEDPKLPRIETDPKSPDPKDEAHNKLVEAVNVLSDFAGKNRVALNMMWTLLTGFLVMFMQAGFAMVETGLTRAKNVAHTMSMNLMVYAIGLLSFWACGFAFMFGGYNSEAAGAGFLGGDANLLTGEIKTSLFGKDFGLLGTHGFFLAGRAFDSGIMTLFLFQMVFMDTAATIPTGTLAERWKFLAFVIYSALISTIIYPVFGNWVWGGGWLSKLGGNFGLGHGHVDFAGSSVVHMTGGLTALVGALIVGPRIGKYNKDGSVNALPAHNVPMYVVGTFILAFGWFGFNPGSTLAGSDSVIGRVAANTMLASGAGALASMVVMWWAYHKPDPSFMCNGLLAGLVAITAPCAFVSPWAAVVIGLVAGVIVVYSCLFWEKVARVDDPVGAVSVHGVCGAWGILALGLFADGTYGAGWNSSYWYKMADGTLKWFPEKLATLPEGAVEQGVTGLFYGNPTQLYAQCFGLLANVVWVCAAALVVFWVIEKLVGNRVRPEVELQGLDVPELGVMGYINEDPKAPEGHVLHPSAEPRQAQTPPKDRKRYSVSVSGLTPAQLKAIWSDLCLPGEAPPPPEFLQVYPHMTTLQGTLFRFRDGEPAEVCASLVRLLRGRAKGSPAAVSATVGA